MLLILGSQSPRRLEILNYFSLPFQQMKSNFDEDSIPFTGNPVEYVNKLSKGKAEDLSPQFPDGIILTADTIVYKDDKIYGKPQNHEQAYQYLKELSGNWHSVYTSLTLLHKEREFQNVTETRVLFNRLTDSQIHTYYQKLPCADKAGGYMIQQSGGIIVSKIDGCYYNVMGLPINSLRTLLLHFGIDLWDHLKQA